MERREGRRRILLGALVLLPFLATPGRAQQGEVETLRLAVIVNAKNNPSTDLTFRQLKTYMKLDREFWENRVPCKLILRQSNSVEMEILLKVVYKTSYSRLQRELQEKIFRGKSTGGFSFTTARNDKSALNAVRRFPGAITVLLADRVPKKAKGIRVLTIEGKKPGDPGYPLVISKPRERTETISE